MRILFCGVGALGSNTVMLCRNLPAELAFADHDRVETKNLLAQSYTRQALGRNKAEALRLQLLNFYGIKAEAFPVRLEATNLAALAGPADLLVDCLDNEAGRSLLSSYARARAGGKPLVHTGISGDGTFGLVRWDERFVPDAADAPGQATCTGGEHLPLIGQVAASLARIIQDYVTDGERRDAMITRRSVSALDGVI